MHYSTEYDNRLGALGSHSNISIFSPNAYANKDYRLRPRLEQRCERLSLLQISSLISRIHRTDLRPTNTTRIQMIAKPSSLNNALASCNGVHPGQYTSHQLGQKDHYVSRQADMPGTDTYTTQYAQLNPWISHAVTATYERPTIG
ncbi:hypothetical protein N7499_004053, partial [Penicillium canescens]